jgi:hypothetical protein
MSSTANLLGSTIGVIVILFTIGWFGYSHYEDTQDERLPLKVKNALVKFQNQLPIKLDNGLTIEKFGLKQSSIYLVLRTNQQGQLHFSKDQMTLKTHYHLCKWRNQFTGKTPVILRFTLIDRLNTELISLDNTMEICSRLPSTLPIQHTM